ncbi:MAG TPA: hypothetical protein VGH74_12305 [Planctomycetaceae bacterium]|jgi:hypothetical protein
MKNENCKLQIDVHSKRWLLALAFSFLHCLLHCATVRAATDSPIESQSYRVRIEIGFGSSPQFDAAFRHRVLDQVSQGIERYVGELWQCEVAEQRGRVYSGLAALERLETGPVLQEAYANLDKAYLLHVDTAGAGYLLAGREWDAQARQLGLLATRTVKDRREVSDALLALVNELFRPIAEIERTRGGATKLHVRGGRFHPPDPLWQPAQPEKLFEVFYCFLDQDQAVERVQQVPWTYVTAGTVIDEGQSDAVVTSGLRAALGSRRHRILTLALGINNRSAGTKLTLMTRAPARKLLAGLEVELSPVPNPARDAAGPSQEPPANDHPDQRQPAEKNPRLITDRNGIVSITGAAMPDGRPVWLLVHSGPVLLARVPFVPGLHSAETLELPDDSLRLEVEGAIALVQAKLVDTVARRAVLMALAKNRAKAGEWEAMESAWKELKEMRQAASFVSDVGVIRIRAVKAARARRDQSTEQRVQKLCAETLELVNNYLDEDKLAEFRTDLDDLKRTELDLAAAKSGADAGEPQSEPAKKKSTKKPKKKAAAAPAAVPAPATGF